MFKELTVDGVKRELDKHIRESVRSFAELDIVPKLAVIRAGDDDGQSFYENAIIRQSRNFGIETQSISFPHNANQALLEVALRAVNEDEGVHGVILLRPFPEYRRRAPEDHAES